MAITTLERTQIEKVFIAFLNAAPSITYLDQLVGYAGRANVLAKDLSKTDSFLSIYPAALTNDEFAGKFVANFIGSTASDAAKAYVKDEVVKSLNAGVSRGDTLFNVVVALQSVPDGDPTFGTTKKAFENKVAVADYYAVTKLGTATDLATLHNVIAGVTASSDVSSSTALDTILSGTVTGQTFTLTDSLIAGVKSMVLTGDQDVRIDMTKTANQITGLDLNGDGAIANDGKENAIGVKAAADYVAVDAYTRLENGVVNETNLASVFMGDIKYDGTGFAGNGTATNGNIVLGGLGADTILGGVGNDFLAAGGVALSRVQAALAEWVAAGKPTSTFVAPIDVLSGGRNADFLFAELSLLTNTDGNQVFIDGGATADNTSAANGQSSQDSDWLLLQASDDDERIEVVLTENAGTVGTTIVNDGTLTTRAGQYATLRDIENIDASGNTYGFLKNLSTAVGGAPTGAVNADNNGIGSSGQLNITGSLAANIIIGGYDNDAINAGAGNDIVMGGNLNMLIDPNLVGLTGNNDGRDELTGGSGADNIAFEADGGIIEGGATQNVDDTGIDTLWLTVNSLGAVKAADVAVVPVAASALITDSTLRFDLAAGKSGGLNNAAGYGGADKNAATGGYTADQTNYTAANAGLRVQVQDMENVIATGLGQIDYKAAGGNTAADLTFTNQQNFLAYNGDIDLRGTYSTGGGTTVTTAGIADGVGGASLDPSAATTTVTNDGLTTTVVTPVKAAGGAIVGVQTAVTTAAVGGVNTLYASIGNDKLEGRTGGTLTFDATGTTTATGDNRDKLSGNLGNDDFIFNLLASGGDGVDVIHRQTDANGDNIWDGGFQRDFGLGNTSSVLNAKLTLTVPSNDLLPLVEAVQFVNGGVTFKMSGLSSTTYTGFVANLNTALKANVGTANNVAVLNADNSVTITDPDGSAFSLSTQGWFFVDGGIPPNGTADWKQVVGAPEALKIQDRIIFQAYEDRLDGEKVDDGSTTGSSISLGLDAYAEDLVVDFRNGSTWLAEDQKYVLTFTNLTTEDKVALSVNGVTYTLTVGVDLDGNEIAGEELTTQGGTAADQAAIQAAFLTRLAAFVTSFMDDDTAAGKVLAAASATTLTLTQVAYNGEETVFMRTPSVVLTNGSGGELATVSGLNNAGSEVQLLDFDGRNAELNFSNVLFLGNTDINRSTFQTALTAGGTITGSEALVIDGGSNTLQATVFGTTTAIADNTATNSFLRTDFTVHGDDLLITAAGADVINGGTGDDRVLGSMGTDTVDGGKSFYAVQVLGEAQARVYVLNQWEATNPTLVTALTGLTISSINRVGDAETGNTTPVSTGLAEVFNDTLQFQQADFSANTNFTVVLNGFTGTTAATVAFPNAGAGQVLVDDAGNNTTDGTTTFTNFENIRTVSGTGNAVAGDGQGNDTLNVSALSTAAGGVSYDLTNDATAGDVNYSKDASINAKALAAGTTASLLVGATVASVRTAILAAQETTAFNAAVAALPTTGTVAAYLAAVGALSLTVRPTSLADALSNQVGADSSDYETQVIKVDGVENVIGGNGADLLMIDETEAAKNNSFTGTLGNDRIEYLNDFNTTTTLDLNNSGGASDATDQLIAEDFSEPTVTIKLDTIAAVASASAGTDTVTMTGGRVGTTVAVDSLIAVERITLGGNTAQGRSEADVIDVTAMATGAVVDYTNGQVRDLTGQVHVTIEGIAQMETVKADGNDTVIVADAAVMNTNARSDESNGTPAQNILFMTYRDFDDLNTNLTTRKSFAAQVGDSTINQVINQKQFTFSLSEVGTDVDVDRVDYSNELGRIVVPVGQGSATTPQYVVVDGDNDQAFNDAESRVDVLNSVEEIVAAKGKSVMDFTAVGQARQITFQYNTAIANPAENAVIEQSIRIADGNGNTISGLNAFIEKYTYNKTTAAVADATWNQIEGSDAADVVIYQGSEDLVNQAGLDHRYTNDTLTLRGGSNEVRYSPLETSVTAAITVVEENLTTLGTAEGLISATISFQDGVGGALANAGTHTITSFSSDNSTAAGNLKIEGSQDAEDTVSFTTASQKVFVLGTSPGVINVNIGALNAIVLTGFERLQDSTSNDVYDFRSLTAIAGVTIIDDSATASADHDIIKVANDAINFNASGANTIDLDNLGATAGGFNFDFDVLDVSGVTSGSLILNGGTGDIVGADAGPGNAAEPTALDPTDEVVLGNLSLVTSIAAFETMVLTQAAVGTSTTFGFNAATNQLTQGSTTVTTTADVLSFGGLVRELVTPTVYGTSTVANVTSGVTVNVTGTTGAEVHGGAGADVLNGSDGADILRGGAGNDTLNGGVSAEVRFIQINPTGAAGADGTAITINLDGVILTLNNDATIDDVDADLGNDLDITPAGGSNAVGAGLATLVNANLADINNGAQFGGVQLLNAAYSDTTGNLTFTFAAGTDVVVGDTIVVAGAGLGLVTVAAEAVVTNGGAAGNDTYIVDAGTDTLSALNASDVIQVYTGATATASGVVAFTATAGTQNLGTVTINAASGGSTIDLALAASTSTLGGVAVTATKGFTVVGGAGVDTITGSGKADTVTLGGGADVFVKEGNTNAAGMDTITDFSLAGGDTINAVINGAGTKTFVNAAALTEAAILAILGTGSRAVATGTDATQFFNVNNEGYSIVLLDDVTNGTWDAAVKLTGVVADVTGAIA